MRRPTARAVVTVGLAGAPGSAAHAGGFDPTTIPVRNLVLDDLGVVDYDRDGDLDVFSTNHLERHSLLTNDGRGASPRP